MQIVVDGERFSPLQALILVRLRKGTTRLSNLVLTLRSLGVRSRSSVYTALYELVERGYVERFEDEGVIYVRLTGRGEAIAGKLPLRLKELLGPMVTLLLNLLYELTDTGRSIVDEIDDPEVLEAYKEYLLDELKRVDEKLSRWRKIRVE
ncbi:MAG: hypothetical protein GSR85_02725 [Desulfurococcales archaeon]|nr:hypothetical protein [Desulfurococcales archaeon]